MNETDAVAAENRGDRAGAIVAYREAAEAGSDGARDNLARLLLEAGDAKAAAAEWARLAEKHPTSAEIRFRHGVALRAAGDAQGALEAYEAAVGLGPRHADARNNLGNLLVELGRAAAAVGHLEAAVALRPKDAPTLCNLGAARFKAGDVARAIDDLRRAIALDPAFAASHGNLGAALREAGEKEESVAAFRRAVALDPAQVEAWSNLASASAEDGKLDDALDASARAVALGPMSPGALAARANVLSQFDRLDEAAALLRTALALQPRHAEALNTLGIVLDHQGRHGEASAAFAAAASAKKNYVDAEVNRAIALLAAGDYPAGFAAYEARWRRKASPPRGFPAPPWKGEALGGRTILLHTEQGLGDAIQFARFVPEVARRGGRVVVECQPELLRLFAGLKGVAATVPRFSPPPPVQCEAPLMSLPALLGARLETLAGAPYLAPHPEIFRRFAEGFRGVARGRLKVGLVWAGNPKHGNDRRRSIAPEMFGRFAAIPGVAFFSLQKGRAEKLPPELGAVDVAPALDDLADASAALAALDLVVSVDTALAHLAGAIGRRALVLLPAAADWRWLDGRDDTPWYASLRLFRQDRDRPGDWERVLDRVGETLRGMVRSTQG